MPGTTRRPIRIHSGHHIEDGECQECLGLGYAQGESDMDDSIEEAREDGRQSGHDSGYDDGMADAECNECHDCDTGEGSEGVVWIDAYNAGYNDGVENQPRKKKES